MLILSRKEGERVHIGDGITVTVLSATSTCVRLGFDAPREIPVHRAEVYAAIHGLQDSDRTSDIKIV